jgi:hypothetical protein
MGGYSFFHIKKYHHEKTVFSALYSFLFPGFFSECPGEIARGTR